MRNPDSQFIGTYLIYRYLQRTFLTLFITSIQVVHTHAQLNERVVQIAEEAYVYGYPVVENYRVIYNSTQNKNYPQYAPFNTFYHARTVATPADTLFVSPNVDTPYSYAVLNIKDEPLVLTIPEIEENRFIGVPFYDLYTHVIYTISPLNNKNEAGSFLIVNEKWKGNTPPGIKKVIVSETDLIYVLIRTQLFGEEDLKRVHQIQDQYKIQTLFAFLGKTQKNSKAIDFIKPMAPQSPYSNPDLEFFNVLNFALQFTHPHHSEKDLLQRLKTIGVSAGKPFETVNNRYAAELSEGIKRAQKSFLSYLPKIKSSSEIFGSRAYLKNNYLGRAVGAWTGIYANEADVFLGIQGFERQADGKSFDGAYKYAFTFAKDEYPPVDAFWSVTMYHLPSRLLFENPIKRYAIQSTMTKDFKMNPDGSVTIYVQHESPGKDLEANWLPCPAGLFTMAFRCYLPRENLKNGSWKAPAVLKSN